MKYLFLALGAGIFVASAQAYWVIGKSAFGLIGGGMALVTFLLTQGSEAKPIIMTNGGAGLMGVVNKVMAGRDSGAVICDPEELLDASLWALLAYGIDFVMGLFVWPVVPSLALVTSGAVIGADANIKHCLQIFACVFLLQICLQQYLVRGGKLPQFLRKAL